MEILVILKLFLVQSYNVMQCSDRQPTVLQSTLFLTLANCKNTHADLWKRICFDVYSSLDYKHLWHFLISSLKLAQLPLTTRSTLIWLGHRFSKWHSWWPECQCLCANTHKLFGCVYFCKELPGRWGFLHLRAKERSGSKRVYMLMSVICNHHDAFLYLHFTRGRCCVQYLWNEVWRKRFFHSINFCNLYKEIPPVPSSVKKKYLFLSLAQ